MTSADAAVVWQHRRAEFTAESQRTRRPVGLAADDVVTGARSGWEGQRGLEVPRHSTAFHSSTSPHPTPVHALALDTRTRLLQVRCHLASCTWCTT